MNYDQTLAQSDVYNWLVDTFARMPIALGNCTEIVYTGQ